ncbi:MAG: DUF3310 domain-containing protein [Lactococcus chungangensis]|uniref:DUF3310 domain-containing protein n=1 Tax=Pseudolactococcus chungangensis TaxID=451457 RepID=A0A847J0S9_9LACT|nr:DUF3310 domain-containing protein [Lactococcus chungangensis]
MNDKTMKLYHTETREDYDALMDELESKGIKWYRGQKPQEFDGFEIHESKTILKVLGNVISYFSMSVYKNNYNGFELIEYKAKKDNINPNHYKFGDIESMDFVDAVLKYGKFKAYQSHYVFNVIKYLVRAPRKNGLEDLKKAKWNLDRLIKKMEVEDDTKI